MIKTIEGNRLRFPFAIPLVCFLAFLGCTDSAESKEVHGNIPQTQFLKLPLSFEANHGQVDAQVKFLSRGPGYGLFLTSTEVVMVVQGPMVPQKTENLPTQLHEATLRLQFVGADGRSPQPVGLDALPGKSHYFLGNDATGWRTNVPHYSKVVYKGVYPGIDLIFYGRVVGN